MRQWIADCLDNHSECGTGGTRLPTRLVDVGEKDDSVPYLKPTSPLDPPAKYAALWHCWGIHPLLTTNTLTLSSHSFRPPGGSDIPLSSLPPSFRDPIHITRALGCGTCGSTACVSYKTPLAMPTGSASRPSWARSIPSPASRLRRPLLRRGEG
jgi:hypothetical protein